MDESRFPLEVCERIIDLSYSRTRAPWMHNKIFRRYAQTCRQWVFRSYYNLYRRIWLPSASRLDVFVRTIETRPRLGSFVQDMRLWPCSEKNRSSYLSFAHGQLLHHLRHLQSLTLGGVRWTDYPPHYYMLVGQYPIRELELWGTEFKTIGDLLRLVWSCQELRSLSLFANDELPRPLALSEVDCARLAMLRRSTACRELKQLHIGAFYTGIKNFPPRQAFGTSLEKIEVELNAKTTEVSVALLDHISCSINLEILEIWLNEAHNSSDLVMLSKSLLAILSSAMSCQRIHSILIHLDLRLWTGHSVEGGSQRNVHSREIFQTLFSEGSGTALSAIPKLVSLQFHMWGDRSGLAKLPRAKWWHERIVKWLPRLRNITRVVSDAPEVPDDSSYESSDDEGYASHSTSRSGSFQQSDHDDAKSDDLTRYRQVLGYLLV